MTYFVLLIHYIEPISNTLNDMFSITNTVPMIYLFTITNRTISQLVLLIEQMP